MTVTGPREEYDDLLATESRRTHLRERTDRGWTAVFFESTAETTAMADDLDREDEEIEDAAWFDCLPENVFQPGPRGACSRAVCRRSSRRTARTAP